MSRFFKIFLLVVLSVFSTLNLSANDTFFSIEKNAIDTDLIDAWKVLDDVGETGLAYCTSCQGVLQQFSEMFPNLKLILVDGVR